jgi:3-oxoacyl-[acyl-carrier protein] reductase
VFLCSRDERHASEAARRIHEETGANVAGIAADVTDGAQAEGFVNLALERAGRVDIFVTNAGGPPATVFADTDMDLFRHAFEQNALSAIRFAKLVLPGMLRQKWGRIVNITSVSVKQPIRGGVPRFRTRLVHNGRDAASRWWLGTWVTVRFIILRNW